jgi:hypothetical protein
LPGGKYQQIPVTLPSWLRQKVLHICESEGRSVSGFCAEGVGWYVDRYIQNKKPNIPVQKFISNYKAKKK